MDTLYAKLEKALKTDPRFVDADGDLFKNEVIDKAYKADQKLIEILISDKELEEKFFSKIKNHLVFNINDFVAYVQDKNFLNDSYTKFKKKIGLNIDGKFLNERKEVALVWPFKDCVLEGGMTKEDQKRKEIFFNEILAHDDIDKLFAPKVLTNWKRYTKNGEEAVKELKRDSDGTIRENLIIKGNNLVALHTLKTQFQGKVKLIYIDPPYNTDGDGFNYNDSFNHSTWLTFMRNRLEVARDMLSENGVIFIQIDYIEGAYLKILADEVFGKDNALPHVTVKTATPAGFKVINPGFINVSEQILIYVKSNRNVIKSGYVKSSYQSDYSKFIKNKKDPSSKWIISNIKDETLRESGYSNIKELEVKFGKDAAKIILSELISNFAIKNADSVFATYGPHKPSNKILQGIEKSKKNPEAIVEIEIEDGENHYLLNGRLIAFYSSKLKNVDGELVPTQRLTDFWDDISWDSLSGEGGVTLKNGKKPEKLLRRIIELTTESGDIVLDYHLGSGTTAAVAHKINRQYIGIEQMDYGENSPVSRLRNVINGDESGISKVVNWKGGGDFVYCELMKYNEDFIDQIESTKDTKALLKIWEQMKEEAFFKYSVDLKEFDSSIEEFKKLDTGKQKEVLVSLLNKNQMYVNLSEMEDKEFKVERGDKDLNNKFYGK
jgi:adenine-specific DNA-methyltransferase